MDNFVYTIIDNYFKALSKLGYLNTKKVHSLLVLIFYRNLMYYDYRGYISKDDYKLIERALNCLYGSTCLIPYPDYLKMNKLRLGEMTELASRTKNLEAYSEELNKRVLDNDVLIEDSIRRLDEYGGRLDDNDQHLAMHDKHLSDHDAHLTQHDGHLAQHDTHLALHDGQIANHEGRLTTAEATLVAHGGVLDNHEGRIVAMESEKVMKKNKVIANNIPDIDIDDILEN